MKKYCFLTILLVNYFQSFAQVQFEVNPPEHIKSIVFTGDTDDQFPIVQLGSSVTLEFDDITASEQDFYYKITHCNYDWTPSQLLKSQYLNGIDDQRITDYQNSYNTLQSYSNYTLTLPNDDVKFKVSGNYMLEIYDNNYELLFSRRFLIYQNSVTVTSEIKRARDFSHIFDKQVVQLNIDYSNYQIVNPKKEAKVVILQNYHWPTALYGLKPQYTIGKELIYKYDLEASFYGGNEYLNFDNKDLRVATVAISRISLTDLYNHFLFPDKFRNKQEYTYNPDINGNFVIRTLQGDDSSREAEYTYVHFSLPYQEELKTNEVYVFGKFNNYALEEENKMTYNTKKGMLETTIKLKQGFYNYKYVVKNKDNTIDYNKIGGNFHFTENSYLTLVYYRNFGDLYDSLIGISNTTSENISN
ncbi:DUF5103 domain-containing protein [Cellulophaga baltica]|uniref:type IX secretion system plug protein n=1 Tax=Cellulophaga TaxID=104264 RepID=UPI001C06A8D2|nr:MULTISPECIES: type IX secretion system plug protein domain-containing protein [Cellulophaga]MBU2995035.1 DUF5103 domain-containing protein [Cellulophaga baltica]MDO6766430.1 DUF5103 domain-containing protein [Cellulophaga sp. 1_MG-2023]